MIAARCRTRRPRPPSHRMGLCVTATPCVSSTIGSGGRDMSQSTLRCDLHVHSVHSGRVNLPLLRHFANDSYSDPRAVYDTARRRGMDLVTLTDHDTIDGALEIAHLPGTFLSEEISCLLPGGRQLHVNAFGIDEAQHARIERARLDPPALFAYLRE